MMEKTLRARLRKLLTSFEEATGQSAGVVSRRALNDNGWAKRVLDGGGYTVGTYDQITVWLAENWPPGHLWPEAVPLPEGYQLQPLRVVRVAEPQTAAGN